MCVECENLLFKQCLFLVMYRMFFTLQLYIMATLLIVGGNQAMIE